MARKFARTDLRVWDDDLDFRSVSLAAQGLHHLLKSQPDTNLCGVVVYRPKIWSTFSTDRSTDTLDFLLDELERAGLVVVDRDADEIWIRSYITEQACLSSPQLAIGTARQYGAVRSDRIRKQIVKSMPDGLREQFPDGFLSMSMKEVGELLKAPLSVPVQLDLALTDTDSDGSSHGSSDEVSDGSSDGVCDGPGAPQSQSQSSTSKGKGHLPQPAAASEPDTIDLRSPDADGGGGDPLIYEALALLVERDVREALQRANEGGPVIRSVDGLRSYRERERREAHLHEMSTVLEHYEVVSAHELVDVVDGRKSKRWLTPRTSDVDA